MKKYIIILLALLLLFTVIPVFADDSMVTIDNPGDSYGKVLLQVEPGFSGAIARSENNGTEVKVLETILKDGIEWVKVSTVETNHIGWIRKEWVHGLAESAKPVTSSSVSEPESDSIHPSFETPISSEPQVIPPEKEFTKLKVKDQFYNNEKIKYYRSPRNVWYFDPLNLSYFPQETLYEREWNLIGRWMDGTTYKQMIYLDEPIDKDLYHGTTLGNQYGFFTDFYLYADLYVNDVYPEGTGSCYLFYSNSLLVGYDDSYGIMIIPEIGVLSAQNNYADKYWSRYNREGSVYEEDTMRFDEDDGRSFWDFFYRPGSEDHILTPFITFDKPISQTELNSYAASKFPEPSLDILFEKDLQKVRSDAEKVNDNTLKVYRLEIIRKDCQVEVYVNGEKMAEFDDMIRTTVEDKGEVPQSVAISYGPVLINGGKTVTCSIGNLAIYSNK